MAPVDLIRLYAGSDARFLRASLESGAQAIVLEATGRGNANDQVVEGVREAVAAGLPVVVGSRCVEGRVEPVYGRGGGRDLADAGALFAGDLAGPKVRVLLQLALGAGLDAATALAAEAGEGRSPAPAPPLLLLLLPAPGAPGPPGDVSRPS